MLPMAAPRPIMASDRTTAPSPRLSTPAALLAMRKPPDSRPMAPPPPLIMDRDRTTAPTPRRSTPAALLAMRMPPANRPMALPPPPIMPSDRTTAARPRLSTPKAPLPAPMAAPSRPNTVRVSSSGASRPNSTLLTTPTPATSRPSTATMRSVHCTIWGCSLTQARMPSVISRSVPSTALRSDSMVEPMSLNRPL